MKHTAKRLILSAFILLIAAIAFVSHREQATQAAPDKASSAKKRAQANTPTFNKEVVRILQKNCQTCHHPGDIAPFSMMTYQETRPWAVAMREQALLRKMPPWKPVAGCGEFREARGLSDEERATIVAWADAGAPEGNPADLPPPLNFPDGWPLGEPDLILAPDEDYTPPVSGDIYRCFSIPTSLRGDRYVSAIDVRPGNARIVHHVIAYIDPTGVSAQLDANDPGPGYTSFWGPGFDDPGILGAWAPGARALDWGPGIGIKLQRNARAVVQVHYHPTGQPESDRTQIGVYFAKTPVRKQLNFLPVENENFSIPAGAANHQITATVTTPPAINAQIVAIAPHMHLLGRRIRIEMTPPGQPTQCLININDWDFNWQSFYYYQQPVALPGGSQVRVTATYDNSAANPRNPHSPPQTVRFGEASTDEMCLGVVGFTFDQENLPVSSPQITGVTLDQNNNLAVAGAGFLPGADIEINGRTLRDTRAGAGSSPLLSAELWRVFAPPGQAVNVTVLNPDGARSAAQTFTRPGAALALTAVSAASFARASIAPEAIVAAFGSGLAARTEAASSLPLPTTLAGTSVRVNGMLAPLFFVSPQQVNLLVPAGTVAGANAVIEITAADGAISRGETAVARTAPGIFTANAQGAGAPAAVATTDGVNYFPVGNPDGSPNPIKSGDFLVLFGTGLRRAAPGTVKITIGGAPAPALFIGAQGSFAGLDQLNTQVPAGISGVVDLVVSVNGVVANMVKVLVQ